MQQAAQWAACSRKTLYRYMNKGLLSYQSGSDGRRYLERKDLESVFAHQMSRSVTQPENSNLTSLTNELVDEMRQQRKLIEQMISLYHPQSIADLHRKHIKS